MPVIRYESMQSFVEDCRRRLDVLKGESSPQEGPPRPTGIAACDRLVLQQVLDRLRVNGDECCVAPSAEREIAAIEHIRQTETWDCGLACVQMILQWLRHNDDEDLPKVRSAGADDEEVRSLCESANRNDREREKAWMMDFVATESIWTIDLVFLLEHIFSGGPMASDENKNDVHGTTEQNGTAECHPEPRHRPRSVVFPPPSPPSYLFCSTKFGVDKSYNQLGYYKDKFSADERRVERLFGIARERNLPLLRTPRLGLDVLADIVGRRGVAAIVLLDNGVLKNRGAIGTEDGKASYAGHYVVLCGVSTDENDINCARMKMDSTDERDTGHDYVMVIKNPSSPLQSEFVLPSIFETAWRSEGTDEDVLFFAMHKKPDR